MVFIDEIHRYSKTQQDALLPHVENGTLTLIGATTENPHFQVNSALLSRLLLFQLNALKTDALSTLISTAKAAYTQTTQRYVKLEDGAKAFLIRYANGDGRSVLTLFQAATACAPLAQEHSDTIYISLDLLEQLAQQNRLNYDRQSDAHYDHASAYQKSMRGGDPDAALYWLAKMIAGGEDPRFIARRLMITAAEDVGLANPNAFVLAEAASRSVETLGLPEGRIPLALATAYVARSAKSNHAYKALDAALQDIQRDGKSYDVPLHLRDSHYSGADSLGHGVGYVYTHNQPNTPQTFLPDELADTQYLDYPHPARRPHS